MDAEVPRAARDALVDAAEIATENVPAISGKVVLLPDVSGSMKDPVTGRRGESTASKIRFVDVAGLMVASVLRKNPDAEILAFDTEPHKVKMSARDSILTNAAKLMAYGGGGTDCSVGLRDANTRKLKADVAIYFSDNQSILGSASWCS